MNSLQYDHVALLTEELITDFIYLLIIMLYVFCLKAFCLKDLIRSFEQSSEVYNFVEPLNTIYQLIILYLLTSGIRTFQAALIIIL